MADSVGLTERLSQVFPNVAHSCKLGSGNMASSENLGVLFGYPSATVHSEA